MICAMILNKKGPKHLVLVLSRTPDFPAFFPFAGVCLSCESDPSSTLHWVLESQHAHDLVPALIGLMGPYSGLGEKISLFSFGSFLLYPCVSSHDEHRGVGREDTSEPSSPGFSTWERDPPIGPQLP